MKLTPKQKKFADNYLETGNATKSTYLAGYNPKRNVVARNIGNENLKKPNIIEYLQENAEAVSRNMLRLALSAENERDQITAGKDVLDRAGFKPTEKIDHTTLGEKIVDSSKVKELTDILNDVYRKRSGGSNGITTDTLDIKIPDKE